MMTEYEIKSLKLLEKINRNLELLMQSAGVAVPEEPVRKPVKVSRAALNLASHPSPGRAGWMSR